MAEEKIWGQRKRVPARQGLRGGSIVRLGDNLQSEDIVATEFWGYTAPSGGITGTGAGVQTAQSLSATGTVVASITGTAATAQAVQSMTATGSLDFAGTGATGQDAQALDAVGALGFSGTADLARAGQSVDAVGQLGHEGSAALEQALQALDATGLVAVPITGTGATDQAVQALSASGNTVVPGVQRLLVLGKLILSNGRLVVPNQVETGTAMMTPHGGFASKFTNNSGATIPHGAAVSASPNHDNSIVTQNNEYDVIGIVYGSIASGASGWVVTSGIAEALFENGNAPIRGYWCRAATTDGRIIADVAPSGVSAIAASTHFKEVGHCLESKSSGTDVLAKIVVHPL